jgi:hypothetical protein
MKRLYLSIGIVAALAIGLGPWTYRTFFAPGEPIALPAFDYRSSDSWAALPAEMPPPVWEDGWAVDVILIGPGSGLDPASMSALDSQTERAKEQATRLAESLSAIGPVYAPLFRRAGEAEDLTASFNRYITDKNRGRAFVIATDHSLPIEALVPLKEDASLRERFGGFLRLVRAKAQDDAFLAVDTSPEDLQSYCPERMTASQSCQPVVKIGRQDGMMIVAQDTPIGGQNLVDFTDWLEANVAKTAEPLGSLEEIEIIDIRRPGDTDESRSTGDN